MCLLLALSGRAIALTNVCFEGKNGHDAGVTPLLMSRWVISGIDAETLGGGLELLREALFVCSLAR